MLVTNFRAIITGKGKDIWRRVLNIECTQREIAQPDIDLLEKIKAEADLILSWLVRGFQRYLQEGLAVPDQLKNANDAYREEMNLLKRFIADSCSIDFAASKKLWILRSDFTKLFNHWLRDEGYDKVRFSPTRVESDMVKMQYRPDKSDGRRIWAGLILKEDKLKAVLAAMKAEAAEELAARVGRV
jgi:putative DNA primase/helicase